MAFITEHNGTRGRSYKVHYVEPVTGRRRSKAFPRKKDAIFFRDNVPKSEYLHSRDTVTIEEAANKWLEVCEKIGRKGREPVEKSTIKPYRLHANYIVEMMGAAKLNQIDPRFCETFKRDLLDRFESRLYARKILTSFKGILSEARSQGWLKSDPAENVRIVISERKKPKHKEWATLKEIKALLQRADEKANSTNKQMAKRWQRYRALVYTAVFSGMRPGELLGLPWRNVSFADNTIQIDQDLNEDGTIGRPKSKYGYRTINMPENVMELLRDWNTLCPENDLGLVFPNWQGNPENLRNIYNRCWYLLQKELDLVDHEGKAKFPLKETRHVRASLETDAQANPKEIQQLLGHSSIKITYDVYGHLFDDHTERRAERANKIADDLMSE